ncbi:MAG: hypothetical protein AMXMBFR48_14590 [Ignavibacteriales bacterium]
MKTIYITETGKAALEERIRRKRIAIEEIQKEKAVAYEISGDGWHDNPGFNQLTQKEEQAVNELRTLERSLSLARIVELKDRNLRQVAIGSIVQFRTILLGKDETKELTMEIVGSGETDVLQKRISYDSPLGAALIGLKPGETKLVHIPKGKTRIEVIALLADHDSSPALRIA